ncbi:MAG: peroxiredoxin-like family protein [Pseudomonadota bacterium]
MPIARLATLTLALLLAVPSAFASPTAADSAETVRPVPQGETAPSFTARNADGTAFEFSPDALERRQLLIFYRGGWCPYCNRHLQALQEVVPALRAEDIDVLFLSADKPELLYSSLKDSEIDYTLVSDAAMNAARAFGVAFRVDDETYEKYKGYGIDLEAASGFDHHELPVPAVYLIDTDGTIAFMHANPDYTTRLEGDAILQAAGL